MQAASGGTIFWRRLDFPGHDVAILEPLDGGAQIHGMAVFDDGVPNALRYRVACDLGWRTTGAVVDGWRDGRAVALSIARSAGGEWTINGQPQPAVAGCIELDLSFTPATNLLPLRRLDLAIGGAADVRSAWLDWPATTLRPLPQRYARRAAESYAYEADVPGTGPFTARLRVDPLGWVRDYPGLWRAERGGDTAEG